MTDPLTVVMEGTLYLNSLLDAEKVFFRRGRERTPLPQTPDLKLHHPIQGIIMRTTNGGYNAKYHLHIGV